LLLTFLLANVVAYSQPAKIYLSPKAAGGGNQSLFIDSLKFYPLEQNNDVEIGRYNGLFNTDKYFIITRYTDAILFLFNKQGKFLKKVSYKKLGEGAYPRYDKAKQQLNFIFINKNYQLTERDHVKIRADFANKKNRKYYKKFALDLNDSSFTLKKAEVTAFDILDAYNLKDDYYFTYRIHVSEDYKDSIDYEVKIYKDDKFVKGYFPYNKRNDPRYLYSRSLSAITLESGKPDTFYITRPFTDTVYSLANDAIAPMYQMVLPMENGLPKSFFNTGFKNKTERDNFERNNGWLLRQIYTVYESKKYMMVTIGFLSNYGRYIYDKKTTRSYNLEKIKPDSLTYNLPVLTDDSGNRQGNKFYTIISPEQLKKAYELKAKSAPFPKELEDCFKDPKKPSPLIVEYTFKTN
jgi:hypothetical protein